MVQYYKAVNKPRAVTLIVHGLNTRPEAMIAYIHMLTDSLSDVYLVSLSGHYQSDVDIGKVDDRLWQAELLEGFEKCHKRATSLGVPVHFLGYSLGALIGQSMIAFSEPRICFNKQVLIAPAIALRWYCYLLKGFFFLGLEKRLPAFTPRQYRVHKSLPLGIYKILFKKIHKLLQVKLNCLNIPTLIIIDPKDELISFKKIKAYQVQFGLKQWQLLPLNPLSLGRRIRYHHCLLDADSMGDENWKLTEKEIKRFLFGNTSFQPLNLKVNEVK